MADAQRNTHGEIWREQSAVRIEVVEGKPFKRGRGRVDYLLRAFVGEHEQPLTLAFVEAKREKLPPTQGLEQVKAYARRFAVRFVYSTNGHQFVEYDAHTGRTREPRPMAQFPSPVQLRERWFATTGLNAQSPALAPLLTAYHASGDRPRYYQDAAIRAVLERAALADAGKERPRALLSLATGAGNTSIAVGLLQRLSDSGQLRRALFLVDRDELREQAHTRFHNVFGADAKIVREAPDGSNEARNARIHIATYQSLGIHEKGDAAFLRRHYPEDHFSHIIIDECHRSAWGTWSEVLTRNPGAFQVGLTATPRELTVTKAVVGGTSRGRRPPPHSILCPLASAACRPRFVCGARLDGSAGRPSRSVRSAAFSCWPGWPSAPATGWGVNRRRRCCGPGTILPAPGAT